MKTLAIIIGAALLILILLAAITLPDALADGEDDE